MDQEHRAQLLIKGGEVVDGTGALARQADVAISDGRIASVGDLEGWSADVTLGASGLVVAPGFIDMHTHSDLSLLLNGRAESSIRQGVTTQVIGQCGFSPAPAPESRRDEIRALFGEWGGALNWSWGSFADYLGVLARSGVSANVVPVVGHNIIRVGIMGEDNRAPARQELQEMQAAVRVAVEEGAFGMSSGLIYAPGMFADTDELAALAAVVSPAKGIYFTHIRSEGQALLESVAEAIEVGRRAGAAVQVSHLKAEGRAHWGKTEAALALIEQARDEGLDICFDVYPYTAWHTSLVQLLPAWAREGGPAVVVARLADPEARARLRRELDAEAAADSGRWERRLLASVETEANRELQGATIAQIAARRGCSPEEAVLDLLIEERVGAEMVGFGMCDQDVGRVLSHPVATIGSDSASAAPYGVLGKGHPHPRTYGTFARVLGRCVRDERLFPLEEAVAKMTSRPAARLGLADRGKIAPGFAADLVLFDANTIADTATYENPHQYACGVRWVIVNGVVELDGADHLDHRPGRVLTRQP